MTSLINHPGLTVYLKPCQKDERGLASGYDSEGLPDLYQEQMTPVSQSVSQSVGRSVSQMMMIIDVLRPLNSKSKMKHPSDMPTPRFEHEW